MPAMSWESEGDGDITKLPPAGKVKMVTPIDLSFKVSDVPDERSVVSIPS